MWAHIELYKFVFTFLNFANLLGHGEISVSNYSNNESRKWKINAECNNIQIVSSYFDTQPDNDILTIDGEMYSGNKTINQTVQKEKFLVTFTSDDTETHSGFLLQWKCKGKLLVHLLHLLQIFNLFK